MGLIITSTTHIMNARLGNLILILLCKFNFFLYGPLSIITVTASQKVVLQEVLVQLKTPGVMMQLVKSGDNLVSVPRLEYGLPWPLLQIGRDMLSCMVEMDVMVPNRL